MGRRFSLLSVLFVFLTTIALGDAGLNHRVRLPRPIKLGVSGGNNKDITAEFCCSGTLGALVKDSSGTKYILSNNHVLALFNHGKAGQDIGQPGLIDVNCNVNRADPVARLSRFINIDFHRPNVVDAAIAKVIPGQVTKSGSILDIGRPGAPVEARLGMRVKKSGRTSGKTKGEIIAIHTSINVEVPRDCGDDHGPVAQFVDQFIVRTTTSRPFTEGGDSGSLVVKRRRSCPRTVGLLFAGDDRGLATVNRIQNVLSALNVKIVGCSSAASSSTELQGTRFDPVVEKAERVRKRNEEKLFRLRGVVGSGIGEDPQRPLGAAIVLFVKNNSASTGFPTQIEGVSVQLVSTSGFKAFSRCSPASQSAQRH
jgi:hypothetical protein